MKWTWVSHGLASRKLLSNCRHEWTSKWTVTISDSWYYVKSSLFTQSSNSYFQMATPTMNRPWTNPPSPNQASPSSQMHSPGWHHGRSPWEDTRNHRAHWGPLRQAGTGTCRGCSCWASCATSPQGVSRWSCAQKIVGVCALYIVVLCPHISSVRFMYNI